jgi:uncharacterized protein YggE
MKRTLILWTLLVFTALNVSAQFTSQQEFSVSAEALVRVPPNRVVLVVGVWNRGKNAAATQRINQASITKAIETAKRFNVEEKNISADYINIWPRYDGQVLDYYQVSQGLSIILEDISKYEALLVALLDAGINQVNNIEFQNTDLKKHRDEARSLAIAAAKEKAAFLTSEAGISLGRVVNMRESSSSGSPSTGRGSQMSQNVMQNAASEGGEDQEAAGLGMISIRCQVTLYFAIE